MDRTNSVAEAVEEVAGEQLGVESWDRPAIYRESATAATESGLPYWLVLVLSGAIATLGLALNSSAVVIGAMLVAPLLAPVVGLALSLAAGDGKLAIQTGAVVLASTLAVVAVGALLTGLLPFQTITLEITARTRPTTLDLAIAVFSGLVGAVVTVARGSRLSAAIPGVAISVALIPPLAVAGFGIGIGWDAELIRGSLLLYGANLAGIVLSGMGVFLVVGMHRNEVLSAARTWHEEVRPRGLAAWAGRVPWLRSVGVFRSPWSRVGLVLAFAVALGIPLSSSLAQIAREARVERAVAEAAALFEVRDRASILNRQVVYGSGQARVYLRVATTEWFGRGVREEFERAASAAAGEPVRLSLEQLPTRGEDVDQLSNLLRMPDIGVARTTTEPTPAALVELLETTSARAENVARALALPEGVTVVRLEIGATSSGAATARLAYAAPAPLARDAEQMLHRQLERLLEVPTLRSEAIFVSTESRPLTGESTDTVELGRLAAMLGSHPELSAELTIPEEAEDEVATETVERIVARGVTTERVRLRRDGGQMRIRVLAGPQAAAGRSSPDAKRPAGSVSTGQ